MTTIVLCALALVGVGVCSMVAQNRDNNRTVCGGITDETDYKAPKVIKSKDITQFKASFSLQGECLPGKNDCAFSYQVKTDANDKLVASELVSGVSVPADKTLLDKLQKIIDEENLSSQNGIYRVTAGLPCKPCHVAVSYASKETLQFTENNNPYAAWAKKMHLLFAGWFNEKGNNSLMPPVYTGKVEYMMIIFKENGIHYIYSGVTVQEKDAIDGERNLLEKNIYNTDQKKKIFQKYILFPKDYYNQITKIISKHDLRPFDRYSVLYGQGREVKDEKPPQNADLQLLINFDDGYQINIETSEPSDIEMLKPLLNDLFNYNDSLFK